MPHSALPRRWAPAAVACAHLLHAPAADAAGHVPPPAAVSIVIDSRPRERAVVAFEREVLTAMASVLGPGGTPVRVLGASERVQVLREWQPADATLAAVADQLPIDDGHATTKGAALDAGVTAALDSLVSRPGAAAGWIVVLAEGNDGGPHMDLGQLESRASASHVRIITLLTATHRAQVGRVRQYGFDLFELSRRTDGRFFDLRTSQQALSRAMQRLARLLR